MFGMLNVPFNDSFQFKHRLIQPLLPLFPHPKSFYLIPAIRLAWHSLPPLPAMKLSIAIPLLAASSFVAAIPHDDDGADYELSPPPHHPTVHGMTQTKNDTLAAIPTKPHRSTGHSHNSHEAVLVELDEDEILRLMGPDPPSYWEYDTNVTAPVQTHGKLMAVHAASMSLAFFGVLPVSECNLSNHGSPRLYVGMVTHSFAAGIVLRAFSNPLHYVVQSIFVGMVVLGWLTGAIYSKFTPNRHV